VPAREPVAARTRHEIAVEHPEALAVHHARGHAETRPARAVPTGQPRERNAPGARDLPASIEVAAESAKRATDPRSASTVLKASAKRGPGGAVPLGDLIEVGERPAGHEVVVVDLETRHVADREIGAQRLPLRPGPARHAAHAVPIGVVEV